MSKKQREREYALEVAHESWLNDQARATSAIKTTTYIKPRTINQAAFVKSIKNNIVSLGHGFPGSGKSILSLFTGIQLINNPDSSIERIVYIRSNIGMGEERDLGAIPGDFNQKVAVLAYPVLDNLIEFMDKSQAEYHLAESNKIEVTTVSFLRGRSFKNTLLIADEVQNVVPHAVKTILSRIGEGSKLILIGDRKQSDLNYKLRINDGLSDAIFRLSGLEGVGIVEFGPEDCQRNGIVPFLLSRYDD